VPSRRVADRVNGRSLSFLRGDGALLLATIISINGSPALSFRRLIVADVSLTSFGLFAKSIDDALALNNGDDNVVIN